MEFKEKMEGAAELLKKHIATGGRGAFERVVVFVRRDEVEPPDAEAAEFFTGGLRDLGIAIIAAAVRLGKERKDAKQVALAFAHKATDGFVTFEAIAEELAGMSRERFEQKVERLMSARQAELAQRSRRRQKRMFTVLPETRA